MTTVSAAKKKALANGKTITVGAYTAWRNVSGGFTFKLTRTGGTLEYFRNIDDIDDAVSFWDQELTT